MQDQMRNQVSDAVRGSPSPPGPCTTGEARNLRLAEGLTSLAVTHAGGGAKAAAGRLEVAALVLRVGCDIGGGEVKGGGSGVESRRMVDAINQVRPKPYSVHPCIMLLPCSRIIPCEYTNFTAWYILLVVRCAQYQWATSVRGRSPEGNITSSDLRNERWPEGSNQHLERELQLISRAQVAQTSSTVAADEGRGRWDAIAVQQSKLLVPLVSAAPRERARSRLKAPAPPLALRPSVGGGGSLSLTGPTAVRTVLRADDGGSRPPPVLGTKGRLLQPATAVHNYPAMPGACRGV